MADKPEVVKPNLDLNKLMADVALHGVELTLAQTALDLAGLTLQIVKENRRWKREDKKHERTR